MMRLSRAVFRALLFTALSAPAGIAAAQSASSAGESRAQIRPAPGPIEIDAALDDPGWEGATRITGFVERMPREGAEPPAETEVWITYDEEHLYVAFIASDPDPEAIRAALQPRDRLWSDDWVGLLLDPYGDASLGYFFLSNPIGVQADLQMTPRGEDSSIDFVYRTAGRITDTGYVVEMAVPFRSLRVPDRDVQTWGIMLVRTYPRSNRHYITWPAWSRNSPCQLCEVASLEGIEGIRTGGSLELLPSVVVSQAGGLRDPSDPDSFEAGSVAAEISLGLKHTIRQGWTAEATVNPDFSQVESDAAQIDVNTTFALFYPERRPFFQEGMDLYRTPIPMFYSRSVNAPVAAAKLTGRAGRTSVGYIGARDEHTPFVVPFEERTAVVQAGRSFTNVLRLQHNLGGSYLGALFTDRRMDGGGSGTTASVDGQYRFGEVYSLSGQLAVSHTREPDDPELSEQLPDLAFGDRGHTAAFDGESFNGYAASLYLAREARTFSWNLLYLDVSPTHRADAGFLDRNDFRRATGWVGMTFYPNRRYLERIAGSIFGGGYWNHAGVRTQEMFSPTVGVALPRQTAVNLSASFNREVFRGVPLTGIRGYTLAVNSNMSSSFRAGFQVGAGRRVARTIAVPEVGEGRSATVSAAFQPFQRLVIEPSLGYERLRLLDGEEVFEGAIVRTRVSFQQNRELNFRLVLQYNDFDNRLDVEPLAMYQLNPFTIFYVGSTHTSFRFDERGRVGTERQYFAKFQYLFQR